MLLGHMIRNEKYDVDVEDDMPFEKEFYELTFRLS
jgi:hypothetical protein